MPDSFYGGKPGIPFIIVANYPTVDDMIDDFGQGPSFTDVHFGEHVLINTENRNHSDNGKIYRRGYDYEDSMGGAIYVGTIVGPAGPAPKLQLDHYDYIQEKYNEEKDSGLNTLYNEGEYILQNKKTGYIDLLNGAEHSAIEWVSYSILDSESQETIAYIGFKFPYLVVDFDAEVTAPYATENLATKTTEESEEKPFYDKWTLKIPKGAHGDSINKIELLGDDTTINSVDYKDYYGDYADEEKNDDISTENGKGKTRQILAYTATTYTQEMITDENGEKKGTENETSTTVTKYLGDYNVIEGITSSLNGQIEIAFTHDDPQQFIFNVIEKMQIDDNKNLLVYYSDEEVRKDIPEDQQTKIETDDGTEIWYNLGNVSFSSGIFIGLNINEKVYKELIQNIETENVYPSSLADASIDDIKSLLNDKYGEGIITDLPDSIENTGKIVTVTRGAETTTETTEVQATEFYAYDYRLGEWYYLGNLEYSMASSYIIAKETDDTIDTLKADLPIGGLWFVVED